MKYSCYVANRTVSDLVATCDERFVDGLYSHTVQGGSQKSKLLYCDNSLLFLSHPVYMELVTAVCLCI